jgi:hypothetical protein
VTLSTASLFGILFPTLTSVSMTSPHKKDRTDPSDPTDPSNPQFFLGLISPLLIMASAAALTASTIWT